MGDSNAIIMHSRAFCRNPSTSDKNEFEQALHEADLLEVIVQATSSYRPIRTVSLVLCVGLIDFLSMRLRYMLDPSFK